MSFRLHPDRDLAREVLRTIRAQIDTALKTAGDPALPGPERAHRSRVACKRAGAAIALIRAHDEATWKREARILRRAIQGLAAIRDADVRVSTLASLQEQPGDKPADRVFARVRSRLRTRSGAISRDPFQPFVRRLQPVADRVARVDLAGRDFGLISAGLEKTYRRARRAFNRAVVDGSVRAFHAWRRHAKAHAYQSQLLHLAWPDLMGPWVRALQAVGRLLGEEHDLALLQEWLAREWRKKATRHQVQDLLDFIAARRTRLRAEALDLGRRIYAESPTAFVHRLAAWWATADSAIGDTLET